MPERHTPENCTCGARLVEHARFCHMCGRPTFEDETPEVAEVAEPLADLPQTDLPQPGLQQAGLLSAAARSGPVPVGFGNPVALRVAILMSLPTVLMDMIPGVNFLFVVWGVAAGWCAVFLYRRMTGSELSVRAGARLGSLTGLLTSLSVLLMTTFAIADRREDLFQQIKQDPRVLQVLNDHPATLVASIILALVILFAIAFAIMVGACAAGGALGARFVGRNSANNRV